AVLLDAGGHLVDVGGGDADVKDAAAPVLEIVRQRDVLRLDELEELDAGAVDGGQVGDLHATELRAEDVLADLPQPPAALLLPPRPVEARAAGHVAIPCDGGVDVRHRDAHVIEGTLVWHRPLPSVASARARADGLLSHPGTNQGRRTFRAATLFHARACRVRA